MTVSRSFRLPPDLVRSLDEESARRSVSRSALAEAALRGFLTPEGDERRLEAMLRRLDRMQRALGRLSRDHLVIGETLALFIRYMLTVTPPMPEDDQDAARALGLERFEHFVQQLARRVAAGRTLLDEVMEEIRPVERDFFTVADFAEPPKGEGEDA